MKKSMYGPTKEKTCSLCEKNYVGMGHSKYCDACKIAVLERTSYKCRSKAYWKKAISNPNRYGPRAEIAFEVVKELTKINND